MNDILTEKLKEAACDYYMLKNRKYPAKGSLKLVGDRYRLTSIQRAILFRGIFDNESSENRRKKLIADPGNTILIIDGYNVIFTILNYQKGHPLFISNDGFLRDAGGKYGRIENQGSFKSALAVLSKNLASLKPESVEIYLDSPVSHSRIHAAWIREILENKNIICRVETVKSADFVLKNAKNGYICSSDSVIIDSSELRVFDLARYCLQTSFNPDFPEIRLIIGQ